MAFCTGCGNKIDDNAKFCTSCGTPAGTTVTPASAATPVAAAAPAPAQYGAPPAAPAKGNTAIKVVLIVVAIIVMFFVLIGGLIGYGAYRASKAIKAASSANGTTVNVPGVSITAGENGSAFKVAQQLGIEVYPGASAVEGSAGNVTIGAMSVGGAEFVTNDSLEQVGEFYRAKYPAPKLSTKDDHSEVIMLESPRGMITINLEASEGKTKINISHMIAPKGQ